MANHISYNAAWGTASSLTTNPTLGHKSPHNAFVELPRGFPNDLSIPNENLSIRSAFPGSVMVTVFVTG